jgi:predicted nuclease of restriction endonuclease-like (RecB) superfamily
VGDLHARCWYMEQTLTNGWSRDVLFLMIQSDAHLRQGRAVTNFVQSLPAPQSDLARQILRQGEKITFTNWP